MAWGFIVSAAMSMARQAIKQSLIESFFSRAGAGLGFKMSGDEEAHAFTAAQFGMLRDFFRTDTIRNEFRGVMLQHFSSSSGPDGKWANLQTETWRRKEWPQMLVESGKLYRSLTNRTALGAVNRIEGSGSKERFVIGTRNPYAQYHHFGTRHMPSRFFMPGDDFGDLIRDKFKQYLEAQS